MELWWQYILFTAYSCLAPAGAPRRRAAGGAGHARLQPRDPAPALDPEVRHSNLSDRVLWMDFYEIG